MQFNHVLLMAGTLDEVESLASARQAMSGIEPVDSLRVCVYLLAYITPLLMTSVSECTVNGIG